MPNSLLLQNISDQKKEQIFRALTNEIQKFSEKHLLKEDLSEKLHKEFFPLILNLALGHIEASLKKLDVKVEPSSYAELLECRKIRFTIYDLNSYVVVPAEKELFTSPPADGYASLSAALVKRTFVELARTGDVAFAALSSRTYNFTILC